MASFMLFINTFFGFIYDGKVGFLCTCHNCLGLIQVSTVQAYHFPCFPRYY